MESSPRVSFKSISREYIRAAFYVFLAAVAIFIDLRTSFFSAPRQAAERFYEPIFSVIDLPMEMFSSATSYLTAKRHLILENERLREDNLVGHIAGQRQRAQAFRVKNLEKLLLLKEENPENIIVGSITFISPDPFQKTVGLDVGETDGVQPGAAVVDSGGLVGQVQRSLSRHSYVKLITDRDFSVSTQNLRTGYRAVVAGMGREDQLALRFVPNTTDLAVGDVFVTSGLDGVFPFGIPVARLDSIDREAPPPFAEAVLKPLADPSAGMELIVFVGLIEGQRFFGSTPEEIK
jgi:rod shape-determining protein MreC